MRRIILLSLLSLFAIELYAQREKTRTVTVRGEYSVVLEYADVTGREAMQLAREDAKKKALEEVCGTRLNIWEQMEVSSVGDVFNSLAINQIDGEIVEFDVVDEGHQVSPARQSETIFYCEAKVRVKRGLAPDPRFTAVVSGIKSVYLAGETLQFTVTPRQDCYMKIFLLEDNHTGYLLYPNQYDRFSRLTANKVFDIASSPYYEFELTKSSPLPQEVNRLVFVFTKTERAFNEEITSRAEIEKWIATLPNDRKFLHFAVIEIRER